MKNASVIDQLPGSDQEKKVLASGVELIYKETSLGVENSSVINQLSGPDSEKKLVASGVEFISKQPQLVNIKNEAAKDNPKLVNGGIEILHKLAGSLF